MDWVYKILDFLGDLINKELFTIGVSSITVGSILYFFFSLVILFFLAERLRMVMIFRVFPRYKISSGVSQAIATIVKYSILTVGFIVIIHSIGIDMSALGIIAGALGVGIGFGLQNITNNFISGIIILFERPIKIGDRIEVGAIVGNVVSIAARATTVITNDNIAVIIPNSEFIASKVINWSHSDQKTRFNFPVGVHYKEDPEKVRRVLLEVAHENSGVLQSPAPDVLFDKFNDSSLDFTLRVWTSMYVQSPSVLKSNLYYAIAKKFKEHQIEIPYPQRDLHIKSGLERFERTEKFN
ncbi:mechanosensitive ion channel [Cytophagaceae bacterium ABcell3]|nr:mechanosensitive ion channel [Cytophagaceae bacterium ABcell3]